MMLIMVSRVVFKDVISQSLGIENHGMKHEYEAVRNKDVIMMLDQVNKSIIRNHAMSKNVHKKTASHNLNYMKGKYSYNGKYETHKSNDKYMRMGQKLLAQSQR